MNSLTVWITNLALTYWTIMTLKSKRRNPKRSLQVWGELLPSLTFRSKKQQRAIKKRRLHSMLRTINTHPMMVRASSTRWRNLRNSRKVWAWVTRAATAEAPSPTSKMDQWETLLTMKSSSTASCNTWRKQSRKWKSKVVQSTLTEALLNDCYCRLWQREWAPALV